MILEFDLNGIEDAARNFWQEAGREKVFAFYGAMGSGKTTFIQTLCLQFLNVKSRPTSPSFSIINEYDYEGGKIFHIDLYRIKGPEEASMAGVEECLHSGGICFVEWAEIAEAIFPEQYLKISLKILGDQKRRLEWVPASRV
jgi:tRNA threonylcarbamoyladenosine biosynthesis protein TsaE